MYNLFLLITYIGVCYGVSNAVIFSNGLFDMFSRWRDWIGKKSNTLGELFTCMMCLPFWVGVILSLLDFYILKGINITPYNIIFNTHPMGILELIIMVIMDGALASGFTWIIHNIEEYFEK